MRSRAFFGVARVALGDGQVQVVVEAVHERCISRIVRQWLLENAGEDEGLVAFQGQQQAVAGGAAHGFLGREMRQGQEFVQFAGRLFRGLLGEPSTVEAIMVRPASHMGDVMTCFSFS